MPAPPAAPGKPKDPSQMSLRRHKRQWNAAYKDFTQKLKAFKNGINGKGDPKFQLPPSDIKFPLPNEVGTFLDGLAGEFQSMVNDAHSIIQDQETYSRVRRKRKPKAAPTPEMQAPEAGPAPAAAPAPEAVVETLSRLGEDHEAMLEVYASSRLSRLWQYTKAPFSKKPYNKQRIALLSLSADLYYQLLDFENETLSLKINSIPKSLSMYQAARTTFDSIRISMIRLIDTMSAKEKGKEKGKSVPPAAPPTTETAPPAPPPVKGDEIKQINHNLHLVFNAGLGGQDIMHISKMIQDYQQEPDEQTRAMLKDQIVKSYNDLMHSIANEAQKKFGPVNIRSPQDIVDLIAKNKVATVGDQIVKEAHNRLTRFLKRQLVKARSYNKTAGARLEIVDIIEETKKLLKKFMDYLEKGIDPETLEQYLTELDRNFKDINGPLSILVNLYEQEFYKKETSKKKLEKGKKEEKGSGELDPIMEYLMKRKVRRDLQRGLM